MSSLGVIFSSEVVVAEEETPDEEEIFSWFAFKDAPGRDQMMGNWGWGCWSGEEEDKKTWMNEAECRSGVIYASRDLGWHAKRIFSGKLRITRLWFVHIDELSSKWWGRREFNMWPGREVVGRSADRFKLIFYSGSGGISFDFMRSLWFLRRLNCNSTSVNRSMVYILIQE